MTIYTLARLSRLPFVDFTICGDTMTAQAKLFGFTLARVAI